MTSGMFFALFIAAMFLTAGLTVGTRIFFLLTAVCLMVLLYGLGSVLWTLFAMRMTAKGGRERVERGSTAAISASVKNRCPLPVGAVTVTVRSGGGAAKEQLPIRLKPFDSTTVKHRFDCPHRGVYGLVYEAITVEDLFGLVRITRKIKLPVLTVEVMPKATNETPMELKAVDVGPEFISHSTEDNASPSDVRNYRSGDRLKHVHWKLTMRRRELMVRTFEESARPDTLAVLDLSAIRAFEARKKTTEDCLCEHLLGLIKAQLAGGQPVRLFLSGEKTGEIEGTTTADLDSFAVALMRATFDSPRSFEHVLMQLSSRLGRTGGLVVATSELNIRTADTLMRLRRTGINVRLYLAADSGEEETGKLIQRMKMAGIEVMRAEPDIACKLKDYQRKRSY